MSQPEIIYRTFLLEGVPDKSDTLTSAMTLAARLMRSDHTSDDAEFMLQTVRDALGDDGDRMWKIVAAMQSREAGLAKAILDKGWDIGPYQQEFLERVVKLNAVWEANADLFLNPAKKMTKKQQELLTELLQNPNLLSDSIRAGVMFAAGKRVGAAVPKGRGRAETSLNAAVIELWEAERERSKTRASKDIADQLHSDPETVRRIIRRYEQNRPRPRKFDF